MPIISKKVTGRRKVRYNTLDDLYEDAKEMSSTNVCALGNWTPGQIFQHLAWTFDGSIDGMNFTVPTPMRWVLTLLMKKKFLTKEIPAGFKSTDEMVPGEISSEAGLAALQKAIARQKKETKRAMHPGFGNISREEWDQFNLRHAEMHMSFLVDEVIAPA